MKISSLEILRCPLTRTRLTPENAVKGDHDEIVSGSLLSPSGHTYKIDHGMPDFVTEDQLTGDAAFARSYYAGIADTYDENVEITFTLYNEDEHEVRNKLVDLLLLDPADRVLEVSAGTGIDSEIIAGRLDNKGSLYCLDISPAMLMRAKDKLAGNKAYIEFVIGSACALPFDDNAFDKLFCFGGVGHFPCMRRGLSEMARVVKPGGRVVFCEKNVPPWLRQTEYGKILINNNPMFAYPLPLKFIPEEARDLCLRWVNGNVHYVVDYTVGEGAPKGNFDLELPGPRGGTFNTRYYGKLEGITPETKKLAEEAQKVSGKSMHKWLDEIIRSEAERMLKKTKPKNEMD